MKLLYKRANHHALAPGVMLKPGLNEVEDAEWEKHKAHPAIQSMFKSGVLFEVKPEEKPQMSASAPSTAKEDNQDEAPALKGKKGK